MNLKFIVLALVISLVNGNDSQKPLPGVDLLNKPLPIETFKNIATDSPPLEKVIPEAVVNNSNDTIGYSKSISQDEILKKNEKPNIPETTISTLSSTGEIISTSTATKNTSTTIIAPSTTTTMPTPNHTPLPGPEEGKWIVRDVKNKTCIIAQMKLQFNVTYDGPKNTTVNRTIFVPKDSKSLGNCSNSNQTLQLRWDDFHSFQILFARNETTNKFEVELFILTINVTALGDGTSGLVQYASKAELPAVPIKMSYKCDKEQTQLLSSTQNKLHAKMIMSHIQLEAFMNTTTASFSEAKDCEAFETPDIVPIAVGCVLSLLVAIVLIAYLIGRKSQSRGYLSM